MANAEKHLENKKKYNTWATLSTISDKKDNFSGKKKSKCKCTIKQTQNEILDWNKQGEPAAR